MCTHPSNTENIATALSGRSWKNSFHRGWKAEPMAFSSSSSGRHFIFASLPLKCQSIRHQHWRFCTNFWATSELPLISHCARCSNISRAIKVTQNMTGTCLPWRTLSLPRLRVSIVIASSAVKYGTKTTLWSLSPKLTSRDKWLNTDRDNFLRRQASPPAAGYRTASESLRHRSQTSPEWPANRTPQQR